MGCLHAPVTPVAFYKKEIMKTITAKELREQIADLDDDTPIVYLDEYEVAFPIGSVGTTEIGVPPPETIITYAVGFKGDDRYPQKTVFFIGVCDNYNND